MYPIDFLAWDSEHFGFPIGRYTGELRPHDFLEIKEQARSNGYKLVYLFAPNEVHNSPIHPIDVKLVMQRSVGDVLPACPQITSYSRDEVSQDLLNLTYLSGSHSRFALDPQLTRAQFESMYQQWITRSIKREIADEVFVYIEGVKILGFLCCAYMNHDIADIRLLSVDSSSQGKGIATKLLQELDRQAAMRGINTIQTTTQRDNHGACRYYEKNNFTTIQTTYIYHLWI